MKNNKLILYTLGYAVLTFIYTAGVAWILFNGQTIFGKVQNFWGPLALLLLFILSATVVGTLVLGKPAILYFNGSKSEALKFFGCTVSWIFVLTLVVFSLRLWK